MPYLLHRNRLTSARHTTKLVQHKSLLTLFVSPSRSAHNFFFSTVRGRDSIPIKRHTHNDMIKCFDERKIKSLPSVVCIRHSNEYRSLDLYRDVVYYCYTLVSRKDFIESTNEYPKATKLKQNTKRNINDHIDVLHLHCSPSAATRLLSNTFIVLDELCM